MITAVSSKLDPVGSAVRYEIMKLCTGQGGRTWQPFVGRKMAMKIFVKRVFTIFASNASFLRVIAKGWLAIAKLKPLSLFISLFF